MKDITSKAIYYKKLYKISNHSNNNCTKRRIWEVIVIANTKQTGEGSAAANDVIPEEQAEGKKETVPAMLIRRYGIEDGKLAESKRIITAGKNIGKKNETTPIQQAVLEAKSLVQNAITTGVYQEEEECAPKCNSSVDDDEDASTDGGGVFVVFHPMLAVDKIKKNKNNEISFPCFAQPKLDGVRLIVRISKNTKKVYFNTRNGKTVECKGFFKTLRAHFERCCDFIDKQEIILDGEVYLHNTSFQDLLSKFKHGHQTLCYHIYDLYVPEHSRMCMEERVDLLNKLGQTFKQDGIPIEVVQTTLLTSLKELQNYKDKMVKEEGYEGIMIRCLNGSYEPGKRSNNLLKIKDFLTNEYKIIGVKEAQGNDSGTAVFVCKTACDSGDIFQVRLKASRECRKKYWENYLEDPNRVIGKMLTVQYQELTSAGVPRFPVGIAIRDYE